MVVAERASRAGRARGHPLMPYPPCQFSLVFFSLSLDSGDRQPWFRAMVGYI